MEKVTEVNSIFAKNGLEPIDSKHTEVVGFLNEKVASLSAQFISVLPWVAALAIAYLAITLLFALGDKDKIEKVKGSAASIFVGFALAIFAVTIVNLAIRIPELLIK